MNKQTKIVVASVVAVVVVVAGITAGLMYFSKSGNETTKQPFNLNDFNRKTLVEGNRTLKVIGAAQYILSDSNNSSPIYVSLSLMPPGLSYSLLYDDHAYYYEKNKIYYALENLTFKGAGLEVVSMLSDRNLTLSFILNNTGSEKQSFSLDYNVSLNSLTNTTLFIGGRYPSSNLTIVPNTYGLKESYSFKDNGYYKAQFEKYENVSVDWYAMTGIYSGGEITFSSGLFTEGTLFSLAFSGVTLPPGDLLNLGSIVVDY